MEIIKKEGKNLEEIFEKIHSEYNLNREDIYYRYYEKNNILGKNYFLEGLKKEDLSIYIKDYLTSLFKNMGLEVTFEIKKRDEAIFLKMNSSNNAIIIGKNGNTLKSLETIVKQKIYNEYHINIYLYLDVENYREKQEKNLEHLAKKIAKEVASTKIEVHLEDMDSYNRRIVHNILADFKGVSTESIGEDPHRHIIIKAID